MEIIIGIAIGLVIGAIASYFIHKNATKRIRIDALKVRKQEQEATLAKVMGTLGYDDEDRYDKERYNPEYPADYQ